MSIADRDQDELALLADDYIARIRAGTVSTVETFAAEHPHLADEIRDLFPLLDLMETSRDGDHTPVETLASTANSASTLPQILGEFRILCEVGRGGMGVVYEAEQTSLLRRVALKVLPNHGRLSPSSRKRFEHEARSAARLQHPNIVPVYGIGEDNGTSFFVMQFIDGNSLDEVLTEIRQLSSAADGSANADASIIDRLERGRGRLPVEATDRNDSASRTSDSSATDGFKKRSQSADYFRAVARIGLQAASAVDHAHQQGILHRDLKPSNLLLDTSGNVWVTDFGLAKDEGQEELTETGDLIGTLLYIAPERFHDWCDPRSDVYSLGLTLYELSTKQRAFDGTNRAELIRRITADAPLRPSRIDRAVPRDLETIILKAIQKEPSQRYRTAGELADDLGRFLDGKPILARRTPLAEQALFWCRRNPVIAGLSVVVLVLLVVGVVASSLATLYFQRLASDREVALVEKQSALTEAQAAKRGADERLYESSLAKANLLRDARPRPQRLQSLAAIRQAAELVDELGKGEADIRQLRNAAIAGMSLVDLSTERTWQSDPPLHFSPDATRCVRLDDDFNVLVCDSATDEILVHLDGIGLAPRWFRFSADQRLLAAGYRQHQAPTLWRIWDIESATLLREHEILGSSESDTTGGYNTFAFDFSSQPSRYGVLNASGDIEVYDARTASPVVSIAGEGMPRIIRWAPDARRLAVGAIVDDELRVTVWDTKDRSRIADLPVGTDGWTAELAWSPDSAWLAHSLEDDKSGEITIWNVASATRIHTLNGHRNSVRRLAFSPAGRRLVSASWDGTVRVWDLTRGSEVLRIPVGAGGLDRQGRWVALAHSRTKASLCRIVWSVEVFHCPVRACFVGSRGDMLAVAGESEVQLADWKKGRVIAASNFDRPRLSNSCRGDSSVIVADREGIWRWPMGADSPTDRIVSPQTPHKMSDATRDANHDWFAHLADYGLTAWADGGKVTVVDSSGPFAELAHPGAAFISFHPSGRWIATGPYLGRGIRVWELTSGELASELCAELGQIKGIVRFSPDGSWLAVHTADEYRILEVGTWRVVRRIPDPDGAGREGRIAFSDDGRLIAVKARRLQVDLYRIKDFELLATFTGADVDEIDGLAFDPSGSYLLSRARTRTTIWDLKAVRHRLESLGLDWTDTPPEEAPQPIAGRP